LEKLITVRQITAACQSIIQRCITYAADLVSLSKSRKRTP
jgi:hypothetical protein